MTISRANNEKEVYFSLLTEPGFLKCGLGAAIVLGLWALFSAAGWSSEVNRLAMSGWGAAAEAIGTLADELRAHLDQLDSAE